MNLIYSGLRDLGKELKKLEEVGVVHDFVWWVVISSFETHHIQST